MLLKDRTSNSVDPDETAHEPSHLDLCCLRNLLLAPMAVKELMNKMLLNLFHLL